MSEITAKVYSVETDSLRDVTDADVERWKTHEAFSGVRTPMLRALIVAEQKLWKGEVTLTQLHEAKKHWLELLGLDWNGK